MNVSITVNYRVEWLPTICGFVSETARTYGADEKERADLYLAAEETAMHIIESVPHDDLGDAFEVTCLARADGVEYVFRNIGMPLDVDALPQYDASAPEASVDGLRLFLARKMVDRLEFLNRGHDGWRTTFFKHLKTVRFLGEAGDLSASQPTGSERITTSIAQPEDAFEIVQLAYLNYRYSYAKESFYYVEKLKEELIAGRIVSFIARAESGALVGHMALIRDEECPAVAEAGAVMVRPEYRRSRGLFSLLKAVLRYRDDEGDGIQMFTSSLVTAHTLSQKLAATMGIKPMALNVSTHPRARFLGLETGSGRESNLYGVRLQQKPSPSTAYVPEEHLEIARELFANAGCPVEILTDTATDFETQTRWSSRHDETTHYTILRAESYGEDFAPSLRAALFELSKERVDTLSLRLPVWLPLPPDLEETLRLQGFFFCGFMHATLERWYLAYARLTNQRFSFDDIEIYDPAAVRLKAYVKEASENLFSAATLAL